MTISSTMSLLAYTMCTQIFSNITLFCLQFDRRMIRNINQNWNNSDYRLTALDRWRFNTQDNMAIKPGHLQTTWYLPPLDRITDLSLQRTYVIDVPFAERVFGIGTTFGATWWQNTTWDGCLSVNCAKRILRVELCCRVTWWWNIHWVTVWSVVDSECTKKRFFLLP